jgi:hypothetical protein
MEIFSGWSLAMSADGDRVAMGATVNNEGGTNSGHVRLYDWNGSTWTQAGQDLGGEAAYDRSGWSVAIGAPYHGDNNRGHVRVYEVCGLQYR